MTRARALGLFAAAAAILALYALGYYLGAHAKHPDNAFAVYGVSMTPAALMFVWNLWRAAQPPAEPQERPAEPWR